MVCRYCGVNLRACYWIFVAYPMCSACMVIVDRIMQLNRGNGDKKSSYRRLVVIQMRIGFGAERLVENG